MEWAINKTKIAFLNDSRYPGEYKQGENGYIDGYVRGGCDTPCAVVVKRDGQIVMASIAEVKAGADPNYSPEKGDENA